jgi:hypothetical protein
MSFDPNTPERKRRYRRKRNLKRFNEDNVLTLPVKRRQYLVWDAGGSIICMRG